MIDTNAHSLVSLLRFAVKILVSAWFFAVITTSASLANGPMDRTSDAMDDTQTFGFQEGSFIVAPIPFSNPMIGAGLTLGAAYLYQQDEKSDTSMIGVAALGSDNGSSGYALTFSHSWNANRWQIGATLAEADVNYDLFVLGRPIPLEQSGTIFNASFFYGFDNAWSIGAKTRYLETTVNPDLGILPPEFTPYLNTTLANFSLVAKRDTTDSSLYPHTGSTLLLDLMFGHELDDLFSDYRRFVATYDYFHSFSDTGVLAGRITGCSASPSTPFFDLCSLGGTDRFRGFSPMQYYDEHLLSAQAEIRQRIGPRFGVVAFGGVGVTSGDSANLEEGGLHFAGGVGGRFKLSKKFDADFSLDVSYNDEEETIIYVYVGQRF